MNPLDLLESLPWALGAFAMVAIFVIYSSIGVIVVRKLLDHKAYKTHHDVAGFVFANLGVLYAVLLGFIVVNAQQRFDKVIGTVQIEAAFLSDLYRDAVVFESKDRDAIQKAIKQHAVYILSKEWGRMSPGNPLLMAETSTQSIWNAYYNTIPKTKQQEVWYAQSIAKVNQLMQQRLARLLDTKSSLSSEMWTLLIFGGLLLIAFVWFFSLEHLTTHLLMAGVLAAVIAFLLYLIYSLDTAFTGNVSVTPEAINEVLKGFQ